MTRAAILVALLALAGCADLPRHGQAVPACAADEAAYACQVERYHNVNSP